VLAVGAAIGLGRSVTGRGAPWLDEQVTRGVATAANPWEAAGRLDLHPPLYALLVRPILVVTDSAAGPRLLSLAATVVSAALVARLARRVDQPEAAALAALAFAAAAPTQLYAWEGRPYALGITLLLATTVALVEQRDRLAAGLGALTTATLYPAGLAAGALAVVARAARPREARAWLPVVAIATVGVGLGATLVPTQLAHHGADLATGHLARFLPSPADAPRWLLESVPRFVGWAALGTGGEASALVGLVGLGALALLARDARAHDAAVLLVVLVSVAASLLGLVPFGPTRHALPAATALVVTVALAVDRLPARREAGRLALALVLALGGASHLLLPSG
jgi:hypothetical protein